MGMTQGVMVGVVAGFGFASLAHGQVLEIEREVSAEAGSRVSGDPVRDSERVSTMEVGVFDESAGALAEIPPLASNRSSASLRSDFESDWRPGEDRLVAEGTALSELFIRGVGDATASSGCTIRFDVPANSSFCLDFYQISVDDRFGSDASQDRPGDANASVALANLDSGSEVFDFEVVLDDAGTLRRQQMSGRRFEIPEGRYELRVEARATDQTDGVEEVEDSLAAATFRIEARIVDGSACPADFDLDGVLTLFDYLAFMSYYAMGDLRADVDPDGVLSIKDLITFSTLFREACP